MSEPRVRIQDFVPVDRSLHREIKDLYFAQRGIAAWTEGEIPCLATNSFPVGRHLARLLLGLAPGAGPVTVLEVGAGLGDCAANLLRALDAEGEAGRELRGRLRYVFSDYSERSVREAAGSAALAEHVAAGRVVPALYDARRPGELRGLDGSDLPLRADLLVANYVACVLDVKQLQRREDGWVELRVALDVEGEESPEAARERVLAEAGRPGLLDRLHPSFEWSPVEPEELFGDPAHARALQRLTEGLAPCSVPWPHGFLDFVRGSRALLAEGGLLLVNDYGELDRASLRGLHRRAGVTYGNTTNLGVHFAVFDAFCAEAGLAVARTREPLHAVHSALIGEAGAVEAGRGLLEGGLRDREVAEDLVDFEAAAARFQASGETRCAIRMLRRCIELDPFEADYRLRIGLLLSALGEPAAAREQLEAGAALAGAERLPFASALGRALLACGEASAAVPWLRAAVERSPSAKGWSDLGDALAESGDVPGAAGAYRQAVKLEDGFEPAASRLRAIQTVLLVANLRARERGELG